MTELSLATQAVLDAFRSSHTGQGCLAAALRAVADQVVPQSEIAPQRNLEDGRESMMWGMGYQTQVTRHSILAIAHELESLPAPDFPSETCDKTSTLTDE